MADVDFEFLILDAPCSIAVRSTNQARSNAKRQTPNAKRQTPTNNKQQTTNNKQQSTNNNQQTTINKQQKLQLSIKLTTLNIISRK
jgi:hypothetical protein